jgi:hypothetical protein
MMRPKPTTPVIVTLVVGGGLAVLGCIVFGASHAMTMPGPGMSYDSASQRMNEVLWSAFGLVVMVAGLLTGAVGLGAWCRENRP